MDGGTFVEAGANDGYEQSNTYYLEKFRGWSGLLVEPVPQLAAECRKNRSAVVLEAALTEQDIPGATAEIHLAGLMSTVTGALGDETATDRHVRKALEVQGLRAAAPLRVPARSLSQLIDEAGIRLPIDLLSLDVEGAEVSALRGLDLKRHAPRYICVEARDRERIAAVLEERYRQVEILSDSGSHQDILFALR